jgi:hypothetical protein
MSFFPSLPATANLLGLPSDAFLVHCARPTQNTLRALYRSFTECCYVEDELEDGKSEPNVDDGVGDGRDEGVSGEDENGNMEEGEGDGDMDEEGREWAREVVFYKNREGRAAREVRKV